MSKYLNSLLQSEHKNNVYIGLCAYEILLKSQAQVNIFDTDKNLILQCLEDPDASIQRKSFALLNSMANSENAQDICEKIVAQQKSVLSDEVFKSLLVEKAIEILVAFQTETPLDWRTFVLLRLLQGASENQQKSKIMYMLQHLYQDKPYTQDQLEIGYKLIKVLATPANEPDAPETLVELYIWALAQFGACPKKSCKEIIKSVESCSFKESICSVALRHLFSIVTSVPVDRLPEIDQSLNEFLAKTKISCSEAYGVQDAIHEIEIIFAVLDTAKLDNVIIDESDFTCSYLDTVIVKALEQGQANFYNAESYASFKDNSSNQLLASCKSLRITPYNVMTEWIASHKNPSLSSSSHSTAGAADVWTLKGRRDSSLHVDEASETILNSNAPNKSQSFEESAIEHLQQWK